MDIPVIYPISYWRTFDCLQVLAIMNKADINIACRFLCAHNFSTHLGKYQSTRSYRKNKLSFVRDCQTVFRSGCTVLRSHQPGIRASVAPGPCQYLVLSVFWILAIVIGMQCYLVVLICNPLMRNDVEHLFMFLFAICISYLRSCLIFCPFLIGLFISHCWVLRVIFVFWKAALYQICLLQIFSTPLCGLSSYSLDGSWNFKK